MGNLQSEKTREIVTVLLEHPNKLSFPVQMFSSHSATLFSFLKKEPPFSGREMDPLRIFFNLIYCLQELYFGAP